MKRFILFLLMCVFWGCLSGGLCAQEYNQADAQRDFAELRARVKANPRDVPAINSLGIMYAREGQHKTAIELWNYALALDPSYVHLYNNLGAAYREMGKKEEARLIYRTGISKSPSYWMYYNLGLLEKSDRNLIEANNCFKKCLELQPGFEPAQKQLISMGYHVKVPATKEIQPVTIGNVKEPVDLGNIGFEQMIPSGGTSPKSRPASKTFTPLTYEDCDKIVKSLDALSSDKVIALTFDDGPHHTQTPALLKVLKAEGVKATFFVVGSRVETYPEILQQIAAAGHEIGNHSWKHNSLTKSSSEEALQSLEKTGELIGGITGKQCNLVRPPYGSTNKQVKELIHSHGWHEVMWDTDSRDWENKDPQHILSRVMRSISPGDIVLFHDIHPGAAQMLPTMIKVFKANGYRFVTINELITLTKS